RPSAIPNADGKEHACAICVQVLVSGATEDTTRVRCKLLRNRRDVDQPRVKIAHFTSELAGGAGVAAQRLHDALRQDGVDSHLYYGCGVSLVSGCHRAFENESFRQRNLAALARAWRNRRNAPGCLVTSPRWFRRTRLQDVGPRPDVINLHWIARWIDQPS